MGKWLFQGQTEFRGQGEPGEPKFASASQDISGEVELRDYAV